LNDILSKYRCDIGEISSPVRVLKYQNEVSVDCALRIAAAIISSRTSRGIQLLSFQQTGNKLKSDNAVAKALHCGNSKGKTNDGF
jgi:hypothetical protein